MHAFFVWHHNSSQSELNTTVQRRTVLVPSNTNCPRPEYRTCLLFMLRLPACLSSFTKNCCNLYLSFWMTWMQRRWNICLIVATWHLRKIVTGHVSSSAMWFKNQLHAVVELSNCKQKQVGFVLSKCKQKHAVSKLPKVFGIEPSLYAFIWLHQVEIQWGSEKWTCTLVDFRMVRFSNDLD